MLILLYICAMLACCYAVLIALYAYGWSRQKTFQPPLSFVPKTNISIVIAARNESGNIRKCLESILQQNYPANLFEIIVVDDFSEDDTVEKVAALAKMAGNLKLLRLTDFVADRSTIKSFKKKALGLAIGHSKSELIITTDADCVASGNWLKNIAAKYQETNAKMIVAPVDFTANNSAVQLFQSLDFMTMQGITAAANVLQFGNMSNGANLAFARTAYDTVNGYDGIDHLASGDDYLLMVKINARFPGAIKYLKSKDAIIRTSPQPDWHSFLQQRVRWASKSGKYDDKRLTGILALVYFFNVSLLIFFVACCFHPAFWKFFLIFFSSKIFFEIAFLWRVSAFFGKRSQLLIFSFLQPLHIIYISLAGFLGWKGTFVWKGRTIK